MYSKIFSPLFKNVTHTQTTEVNKIFSKNNRENNTKYKI